MVIFFFFTKNLRVRLLLALLLNWRMTFLKCSLPLRTKSANHERVKPISHKNSSHLSSQSRRLVRSPLLSLFSFPSITALPQKGKINHTSPRLFIWISSHFDQWGKVRGNRAIRHSSGDYIYTRIHLRDVSQSEFNIEQSIFTYSDIAIVYVKGGRKSPRRATLNLPASCTLLFRCYRRYFIQIYSTYLFCGHSYAYL